MKIWIVTNKNVKQFRVTNIAHHVSEYLYKDRLQKNEMYDEILREQIVGW